MKKGERGKRGGFQSTFLEKCHSSLHLSPIIIIIAKPKPTMPPFALRDN